MEKKTNEECSGSNLHKAIDCQMLHFQGLSSGRYWDGDTTGPNPAGARLPYYSCSKTHDLYAKDLAYPSLGRWPGHETRRTTTPAQWYRNWIWGAPW